jgi:RimJ/RimL family protein N-acetyltransferase
MRDADLLLVWANDPMTRKAGFHPEPIAAETHEQWLASRVRSGSDRLYIGLEGTVPVGQVRLDASPEGHVEIGISVAPGARGRGIGQRLLSAALDAGREDPRLHVERYVARIRPENAASIALFTGLGFRPAGTTTISGQDVLIYELPLG